MPQRCNNHVGAISFDFCEGPLAWGEDLACLTTLGNILCVPNDARLEEAKAQILDVRVLGPTWHPEKPWWASTISSLPSCLVMHLSRGWTTPFRYKVSSMSEYCWHLYASLDCSEGSTGW